MRKIILASTLLLISASAFAEEPSHTSDIQQQLKTAVFDQNSKVNNSALVNNSTPGVDPLKTRVSDLIGGLPSQTAPGGEAVITHFKTCLSNFRKAHKSMSEDEQEEQSQQWCFNNPAMSDVSAGNAAPPPGGTGVSAGGITATNATGE
jgi:hypothetical protein